MVFTEDDSKTVFVVKKVGIRAGKVIFLHAELDPHHSPVSSTNRMHFYGGTYVPPSIVFKEKKPIYHFRRQDDANLWQVNVARLGLDHKYFVFPFYLSRSQIDLDMSQMNTTVEALSTTYSDDGAVTLSRGLLEGDLKTAELSGFTALFQRLNECVFVDGLGGWG